MVVVRSRGPGFGLFLLIALAAPAAFSQSSAQGTPDPAVPPPAAQETMYLGQASGILGREVSGPDAKDVGRIVDVLVDDQGQPRAAVVDVGGFLGIGNRRIAVAWRALHFAPDASGNGRITLEMTANQIKAMPEYKAAKGPVVVAAPPQATQASP